LDYFSLTVNNLIYNNVIIILYLENLIRLKKDHEVVVDFTKEDLIDENEVSDEVEEVNR